MSRSTKQKVLLAVSAIGIIVGTMDVLSSTLFGFLGKVVVSVSPHALEQAGITFDGSANDMAGALKLVSYAAIVSGIAEIVAGSLGIRAARDASRATPALLAASICLVVAAIDYGLGLTDAGDVAGIVVAAFMACLSFLVWREAQSEA